MQPNKINKVQGTSLSRQCLIVYALPAGKR